MKYRAQRSLTRKFSKRNERTSSTRHKRARVYTRKLERKLKEQETHA